MQGVHTYLQFIIRLRLHLANTWVVIVTHFCMNVASKDSIGTCVIYLENIMIYPINNGGNVAQTGCFSFASGIST